MCTHLTRLTLSAAGVVLTSIGMAAAAYAGDDDLTIIGESTQTLEPVDKCEIDFTIEECGLSIDDEPKPVFTYDPDLIDPGVLDGDDDTSGSGDDTPDEPEGGGSEDPADGESGGSEGEDAEEPAGEPGTTEDDSGSGSGSSSGQDESSGSAGETDATEEPTPEETAAEPTPEPDDSTVTPSVESTSSDGGGNSDLLFAVLVAALAAFGLGIVGFGLGRRPKAAGSRRR